MNKHAGTVLRTTSRVAYDLPLLLAHHLQSEAIRARHGSMSPRPTACRLPSRSSYLPEAMLLMSEVGGKECGPSTRPCTLVGQIEPTRRQALLRHREFLHRTSRSSSRRRYGSDGPCSVRPTAALLRSSVPPLKNIYQDLPVRLKTRDAMNASPVLFTLHGSRFPHPAFAPFSSEALSYSMSKGPVDWKVLKLAGKRQRDGQRQAKLFGSCVLDLAPGQHPVKNPTHSAASLTRRFDH